MSGPCWPSCMYFAVPPQGGAKCLFIGCWISERTLASQHQRCQEYHQVSFVWWTCMQTGSYGIDTVNLKKTKLKKPSYLTPWVDPCGYKKRQSSYLKQELTQGDKRRSVVRFLGPTLQHDIIDILRTVFRLREAFTFFINLVQDLVFFFTKEKTLASRCFCIHTVYVFIEFLPGSHSGPAKAPGHAWTSPTEWLQTSMCL